MVNTNKVPLRRIDGINNYKTNCITEIPQDIKLELADGVLTLKAGSKIYVPNGFEEDGTTPKFDEVVIESDSSQNYKNFSTSSNRYIIVKDGLLNIIDCYESKYVTSGETEPSEFDYVNRAWWYDTKNNLMKKTSDSGLNWEVNYSLPIGLISIKTDVGVASIDQIFNGFGYIGSTVFALPGVKGLIPNGRNEDGTLNNKEFDNNKVLTYNVSATFLNGIIGISNNGLEVFDFKDSNPISGSVTYQEDENFNYASLVKYIKCLAGKVITEKGVVTSFNPKKVFKEVDQNDFSQLFEDNMKQKIKVVSDLPSNPEVGVLYYVKE